MPEDLDGPYESTDGHTLLQETLRKVIHNHIEEWDTSLASLVGTLEILKHEFLTHDDSEDVDVWG